MSDEGGAAGVFGGVVLAGTGLYLLQFFVAAIVIGIVGIALLIAVGVAVVGWLLWALTKGVIEAKGDWSRLMYPSLLLGGTGVCLALLLLAGPTRVHDAFDQWLDPGATETLPLPLGFYILTGFFIFGPLLVWMMVRGLRARYVSNSYRNTFALLACTFTPLYGFCLAVPIGLSLFGWPQEQFN